MPPVPIPARAAWRAWTAARRYLAFVGNRELTGQPAGHLLQGLWARFRELWLWPPDVQAARLSGDLETLAEALRYTDDYIREEAADALAEEGAEGVAILRRALADLDPRARESATHGLNRVEWAGVDEQTRATLAARLREVLEDTDPHVRAGAASALGQCGGPKALDALELAVTDPVEEVRLAAAAAIGRLEPNVLRQWLCEPSRPRTTPRSTRETRSERDESAWNGSEPDGLEGVAAQEQDPLAWLTPGARPETRSTAKVPPPRIEMAVCPRCQRLCNPTWVRCHRCGARLRA
jgi:hypothetical protein